MRTAYAKRLDRTYRCILRYWQQHHRPLTMRDLVSGVPLSSLSVAEYHVTRLEQLGLLRKRPLPKALGSGIPRTIVPVILGEVTLTEGVDGPIIGDFLVTTVPSTGA